MSELNLERVRAQLAAYDAACAEYDAVDEEMESRPLGRLSREDHQREAEVEEKRDKAYAAFWGPELARTCIAQAEEIEKLRAALAWYADKANWMKRQDRYGDRVIQSRPSEAEYDEGAKARTALAEEEQ